MTLPPPRDLPPCAHSRIRLRLEHDEPAPRRMGPLIATAGLTAGALVAVVVWLVPGQGEAPVMAAQAPTSPAITTVPTTTTAPGFPGLTPAEVRAIETGCGASAIGDGGAPETTGVGDTADTIRLRILHDDDAGRVALLYGKSTAVSCDIGGPVMEYSAALSTTRPPETPITVDIDLGAMGDGPEGKYPNARGTETVAGRVTQEQVVRVSVTKGGDTENAILADGVYLARFVHEIGWQLPSHARPTVVRAYDADGVLLATLGG